VKRKYEHPRIINITKIRGHFLAPMMWRHASEKLPNFLTVSTVCLEGAHREDPLHILSPEKGFETMVFMGDERMTSMYECHYKTRSEAFRGHRKVCSAIMKGKLRISPKLTYTALEVLP
jgi:hypothetical protein